MSRRKLAVVAVVAVVGLLGFATAGIAFAQGRSDAPTPVPPATTTPFSPYGHMGNFEAMQGYMAQAHPQVQDAVAKVLGLTVDELNTELGAGKTLPQIAQEKGVDWSTVVDAMQTAHPDGYGPRMMNGTGWGGCPRFAGATPGAS